ncbi:MAG: NAD(P)/FAD-dependent oxidoreductase [Nocardioidaceae bacterium]
MSPSEFNGGPVVIIGGGVVGVSIAYHLAIAGHDKVTVLERGLVGEGSTGKATGGIRQQFTSDINVEISRRAVAYFESFADLVGEPLEFRQHGYLFAIDDAPAMERAADAATRQQHMGVPVQVLTPGEVAERCPGVRTTDLAGGTYCPTDGSASPSDTAAGFARQARRHGVDIRTHTSASGIVRMQSGRVREVLAGEDRLPAEIVIDAAGAWARQVGRLVGFDPPIEPHPRQAFAVPGLDWFDAASPMTVDMGAGVYVHPERSGAIIGGGDRSRPESFEATIDHALFESTIESLVHRFPRLDGAQVSRGWVGLREMTPDDHALVGPVTDIPGFWIAAGFSGHGFMHSPVIGQQIASWLLDGTTSIDLAALDPERFTAGKPDTETLVF